MRVSPRWDASLPSCAEWSSTLPTRSKFFMEFVMLVLLLLQVKHWYIDFVMQTPEMVAAKGKYGDPVGIWHSAQHSIATLLIMLLVTTPYLAVVLALLDFVTHYHIDWYKMNKGCRDIQDPKFWNHLGLDQMAHQIVYLVIASIALL